MRRSILALLLIGCDRQPEPAPAPTKPLPSNSASVVPSLATSVSATPSVSVPLPTDLDTPSRSLDDVGKAYLAALAANDDKALLALEPKPLDYAALLYPEFVKAGEPLIGSMGVQWAWDNLANSSRKDRPKVLRRFGGKKFGFVKVRATPSPRGAVTLHQKPVVEATLEGKPVDVTGLFAIVERGGRFCVLRYVDND